jgi:hypothetical protein
VGLWPRQQRVLQLLRNQDQCQRIITYNLNPTAWDQPRQWTPYVDGYTTLRVPVAQGPKGPVPQSAKPGPVLLRAGGLQQWYRDQEPGSNLVTSSESNPQLATGTAYNEIVPDTTPIYRPIGFRQYIRGGAEVNKIPGITARASGTSGAAQDVAAKPLLSQSQWLSQRPTLPVAPADDSRAAALIELLSNVATDKGEIEALNEILHERALGISVKRDKG